MQCVKWSSHRQRSALRLMLVHPELSCMTSCAETSYGVRSMGCGSHAPMLSSKGKSEHTVLVNFSQGGYAPPRAPRRHICAAKKQTSEHLVILRYNTYFTVPRRYLM